MVRANKTIKESSTQISDTQFDADRNQEYVSDQEEDGGDLSMQADSDDAEVTHAAVRILQPHPEPGVQILDINLILYDINTPVDRRQLYIAKKSSKDEEFSIGVCILDTGSEYARKQI